MSLSFKIYSLILTMVFTLGCAATVLAQQSLTFRGDSDFAGLCWEIEDGRYIIGIGNGVESYSERVTTQDERKKDVKTSVETLHLLLGSRIYLNQLNQKGKKCSGFFAEGDLLLRKLDMEYNDYLVSKNNETKDRVETSISVLAGYKIVFGRDKQNGFTLELAVGERFNSGDDFHDYEVERNEGFVKFGLGYAW
jgi:hypothetical protein